MHVFAKVGADQYEVLAVLDVKRFRAAHRMPESQFKCIFPGSTALGVGWGRNHAAGGTQNFQEGGTESVSEGNHGTMSVFFTDAHEIICHQGDGLFPVRLAEHLLTVDGFTDERMFQSVGIIEQPMSSGSPGTQPAVAQRMLFLARDFVDFSVTNMGVHPASPETKFAKCGNNFFFF